MREPKSLLWMGDSLKQVTAFPEEIKDEVGYSLHLAQEGLIPLNAKALRGFKPLVMEIKHNGEKSTYRAVYTAKMDNCIYVLHCFQKKSKTGIKTPKQEIDLIKQRLKEAISLHQSTTERELKCVPIE